MNKQIKEIIKQMKERSIIELLENDFYNLRLSFLLDSNSDIEKLRKGLADIIDYVTTLIEAEKRVSNILTEEESKKINDLYTKATDLIEIINY